MFHNFAWCDPIHHNSSFLANSQVYRFLIIIITLWDWIYLISNIFLKSLTLLDDIQYILKKKLVATEARYDASRFGRSRAGEHGEHGEESEEPQWLSKKSLTEKNEKNEIIVDFMRFS